MTTRRRGYMDRPTFTAGLLPLARPLLAGLVFGLTAAFAGACLRVLLARGLS
jgi:hypothetical protein